MSCNYADGLSAYENKGILGVPERFDTEETIKEKCDQLAKMIMASERVVVHTGAGISTAAGIPDFRSPQGVWTLERQGLKPTMNVSFDEAIPTKTHMALKALVVSGHVKYIISQNIDGLHLRSGLPRQFLAELHGNMFIEECNKCHRQFVRNSPAPTVGQKETGGVCKGGENSRPCRGGRLLDTVLDWEDGLPEKDLDISYMQSSLADLNICLGTTLQIVPSGNLPIKNKKHGGKVVICNLQPTKHDKKADLIISTYVDNILVRVLKKLGQELPEYSNETDPTKQPHTEMEWTISNDQVKDLEKLYNAKLKEKRESNKKKRSCSNIDEMDEKKRNRIGFPWLHRWQHCFRQFRHRRHIVSLSDVWCLETRLIMQLYIRGEKTHVLNVEISDTVAEIKAKLALLSSEECDDICLTCEGTPLTNDALVCSLTSCELDLTLPLLGGKVHGSLARAGKVKGQTPKVDKQEKKKKKTGRAKRRIQYNRRFVNVVQSFGRRRGPNAKS